MSAPISLAKRAEVIVARGFPELTSPVDVIPESAVRAVQEALARGETHYTDRPGILPLREAVTKYLQTRFGVSVNAKANTVITCGVTEARFVAVQQLLQLGETLLAPEHKERLEGALTLRDGRFASTSESVKLVYLSSSISEAKQREWLSGLSQDVVIVYELDELENTFHPAHLETFKERTVTIGDVGTEKGLLSWRVGFIAAPPSSASGLRDFKQALTICTTNLSQWAALAVMEAA